MRWQKMSSEHPLVAVREFRERIHTYTEPVTVVHTRGQLRILGTWYPDGVAPEAVQFEPSLDTNSTSGSTAKVTSVRMKP